MGDTRAVPQTPVERGRKGPQQGKAAATGVPTPDPPLFCTLSSCTPFLTPEERSRRQETRVQALQSD